MNKQIKENKLPIMIGVVVAVLAASSTVFAQTLLPSTTLETPPMMQPQGSISFAMVELSLEDLVQDSELIIQGKIIEKKQGKNVILGEGSAAFSLPLIINEVQVNKVIKGTWQDKTINVVTEGDLSGKVLVEDAAEMKKSKKVVLFLRQESVYNNAYALVGKFQGKFDIDDNNQVDTLQKTKAMNTTEVENQINEILGVKPKLGKNSSPFDSNSNATTEVEDKTKVEEQKNEENMSQEKSNEEQKNEEKIPQETSNEEEEKEQETPNEQEKQPADESTKDNESKNAENNNTNQSGNI